MILRSLKSVGSTQILFGAITLLCAAIAETFLIGFSDPRSDYVYEVVIFLLAAGLFFGKQRERIKWMPALPLAAILAWGFFQLVAGSTVYRYVTLQSSLRWAALAATSWAGFCVFGSERLRVAFVRALAWIGMVVAVVSVLAYFTSPGKILWTFHAPYPDIWGPFLSRNNFAQFLELAMPAALWVALREPGGNAVYLSFAAIMLAAGLASASRAGSLTLLIEAIAVLWTRRKAPLARRTGLGLILATAALAAVPGVGHLLGRVAAGDSFEARREIARATVAMISARPWTGFGLGTFPVVYPSYAVFDVGNSVEHAHNDWLEWTVEGGIGFCAVWVVLAVWSGWRAATAGWGMGVLGCFLHGLVDYPFARLGISAWIFLLLGILATSDLREVQDCSH
jgi:O-antigen ligase